MTGQRPDRRDAGMDDALRALAEPRRRAILQLVAHSELSAGEIAGCFDVTRTAVSQHLTVLKKQVFWPNGSRRPAASTVRAPKGWRACASSSTRCGHPLSRSPATWSRRIAAQAGGAQARP